MRAGAGTKVVRGAGVAGILILIVVAAVYWRATRRGETPAAPPLASEQSDASGSAAAQPAAADSAPAAPPGVQPEDARSKPMAEPFRTGRLPDALPHLRGNPDAAAATLAAFIAARDDQSVPALLTAIMTAGFAVRHEDGRITQTVTPGQGLAFDGWEVAAMAKMYRERRTMPLSRLVEDLRLIPELGQVPLDRLLLDGITHNVNGSQPQLRFWARLIVELGRRAARPYDLLARADPAAVELDPVQAALILRRLFGDLAAPGLAGRGTAVGPERLQPAVLRGRRPGPVAHALTLPYSSSAADAVRTSWALPSQDPCSEMGKGDAATILDAGAVLITTGWGQMLDAIGAGEGGYAKFLTIANTLLAYAKLIATYASIDTEISMENPPLVRTTNAEAGERRQLTATLTVDSGGSDKYNCVRTALNVATGLDFSMLGDGPLAGVELTWRVDNPGEDYYSNSTGITGNRPVVGITTGGPRIQDPGTYAGVGGDGTRVGDHTRSTTDERGQARIYLEGTPRIPYVPPPRMPVMKEAVVRTNLKLKGGDVKGDAVDVAAQALGGVGALATMPIELLFRVPWATMAHSVVQIKDWETCTSEDWYGTIVATTRYENVSVRHGETAEVVLKHESRYSHDATVNVAGDTAVATITSEELVASDQKSGYGRVTSRRMSTGQYSGDVRVWVSADARLGTYDVGFERPDLQGTTRTSGSCERPAPYKCQQPAPTSQPWDGDGRYLSSMSGKIDPNNPTVISDTQTVDRGALEHTFTVSLQRCR